MVLPRLADHQVIVVGGSSGIGFAVARQAKLAGAQVTLVARNPSRLREAAEALGDTRYVTADLLDSTSIPGIFQGISKIDHLIITAGTASLQPLSNTDSDSLQKIVMERLIGPLLLIKSAIRYLSPTGSVTLTSAQLASRPIGVGAIMAGTTAAIESIGRALALELAPVRINVVAPGMTDTPLLDKLLGPDKEQVLSEVVAALPVRRIASADDVARAILFLMSASSVTGEVLHIDGGARWI